MTLQALALCAALATFVGVFVDIQSQDVNRIVARQGAR